MPQDLATLSGRPKIREYAMGRAAAAIGAIAAFIAPSVNVSTHTGKYSEYNDLNRFKIPETLRGIGGKATQLAFNKNDRNYDCSPHAIDIPLDNIEIDEAEGENLLMENADEAAAIAGMANEKTVLDLALNRSAVGGKGVFSSASVDPIQEINEQIIAVYLAAGGYPSIEVGVVLDPTTLMAIFANVKTKGYFPAKQAIAPTLENLQQLLIGKSQVQTSWLAIDSAAEGKDASLGFAVSSKVLIFARSANPTRRDPSAFKTFRPRGRWMVPGTYNREDGRGQVVKMDWSEDVKETNSAAVKLIAVS